MTVTVKPVTIWHQDTGPDPIWRYAVLEVTGTAPGRWTVRNNSPGWYLHISHNGFHVGMANWNAWDAVAAVIAHESGPYTVTVSGPAPAFYTGAPLSEAKLIAYRAEQTPCNAATITNADGNEVRWPRRTLTED